jgi:3-phenylpropionate/trans-cinnamate dioxygenase ferredoxin reductase subunit
VDALRDLLHVEAYAAGVPLSSAKVDAILGDTAVMGMRCADNQIYPADFVVIGIGVAPCIPLAAGAGLECHNGICTGAQGRTSDPHVFAAGDCACTPRARYGRSIRLESVDNTIEQANAVCGVLSGRRRRRSTCRGSGRTSTTRSS